MTKRLLGLALVLMAAACHKDKNDTPSTQTDDDSTLGEDGSDTSSTETDSELLVSSLVAPSTTSNGGLALSSTTADLSTATVGEGAQAFFFPRGCLTTTSDEATAMVTYKFDKCTGPNGLFRISGELVAHYTVADRQLTLDITGTGVTLNKATVDYHATAVITAPGPIARAMTWKATMSGTTARGRELTRTVDKTVTWRIGERCFTVNGTSEGDVGKRSLKTVIDSFTRCQGACPEAGGKITVTNTDKNKTIEIDFDGTAQAKVTPPNGVSFSVPLFCSE